MMGKYKLAQLEIGPIENINTNTHRPLNWLVEKVVCMGMGICSSSIIMEAASGHPHCIGIHSV